MSVRPGTSGGVRTMTSQTIVAPDVSGVVGGAGVGVGGVRAPRQNSAGGSGRMGSGRGRNLNPAAASSSSPTRDGSPLGGGSVAPPAVRRSSSSGRPETAPDHASRRGGGITAGGGGGQFNNHGRPATAAELSQRSSYNLQQQSGLGGGGGPRLPHNTPSTSGRFPRASNASMIRPGTSGSRASLSRSGVMGGGGDATAAQGSQGSWTSFVERIPDRASDAVWKHKDISYRHDRVGHGAGNRTLKSGRQSMYLDTVVPPSLLEGNGNKDYRDGSKKALERLIRTVTDETGGGVGGLGSVGGSVTLSSGTGRPKTSGGGGGGGGIGGTHHYGGSPGRSFRPTGALAVASASARGAVASSSFSGEGYHGGGGGGGKLGGGFFGGGGGPGAPAREHSVEVGYASWVQAVGEGAEGRLPAGRSEVELLRAWLKGQLEKTSAAHDDFGDDEQDPGDVAADIQEIYDRGACELARQVTVHCAERGSFLSELWEGHTRVLGAVLQRLAQERKVLAENSMDLLTRVSSLEQEKTALLASNLELERQNQNLREAVKAALKERDQATVEMKDVKKNFDEHLNNVELWLPHFPHYRETQPFLDQLRANRGVPAAAMMSKDPEKGPKLFEGGNVLVENVERLVKMFISLSRGTPSDWNWEGKLVTALSAAGVKFDGDKGAAAIALLKDALLDLEERLRRALKELEDERYKRVMQDQKLREIEGDLAEKRKELIWRRAFAYCEWHPRKVEVQAAPRALVCGPVESEKKPKGRQILPTSCIPAPFQLLFTTAEAKDYIPKSRFPEKMQFMTKGQVIQIVKDVTQAKLVLEDKEGNRELLPDFVYGFMLRKYGLVKLAETKTIEFLASCLKHKLETPRIMMFCRFLALRGSDPLSAAAFEFLLTTIRTIDNMPQTLADKYLDREAKKTLLNTPMVQQLSKDGGLERYVSVDRAKAAFKMLFNGKEQVITEAMESIDSQGELEDAGRSLSFTKISMEAVEGIAITAWESTGGDTPSDLEELFLQADENKDGVLTYEEFAKLIGVIKPDMGLLKTLSIFREALTESASFSGDVITPDAFARVMSSHGITRLPDSAKSGDGGDQELHVTIGAEREAFKIDYILLPRGFMDQYYLTLTKMFQAYGKAVSKIVEDFEVEGRMSLKDWISFCTDAAIVGGPKGLTKGRATAIFQEANGDRFEQNDSGTRVVQKDHDADSMQYDEFKYGLALTAHFLFPDKDQLGEKIDALVEERIRKV